jgi:hypothetical protein
MTQSSKTYMKNTSIFLSYTQLQDKTISKKVLSQGRTMKIDLFLAERKSLDGNPIPKYKNQNLFLDVFSHSYMLEPVHYEKIKLKPPIPRINSKTPTKRTDLIARDKSPSIEKRIVDGSKI